MDPFVHVFQFVAQQAKAYCQFYTQLVRGARSSSEIAAALNSRLIQLLSPKFRNMRSSCAEQSAQRFDSQADDQLWICANHVGLENIEFAETERKVLINVDSVVCLVNPFSCCAIELSGNRDCACYHITLLLNGKPVLSILEFPLHREARIYYALHYQAINVSNVLIQRPEKHLFVASDISAPEMLSAIRQRHCVYRIVHSADFLVSVKYLLDGDAQAIMHRMPVNYCDAQCALALCTAASVQCAASTTCYVASKSFVCSTDAQCLEQLKQLITSFISI